MDSSDSSTISSNSAAENDDKTTQDLVLSSNQKQVLHGPYFLQQWLLPESIIFYLAKNPSNEKAYQKLIQSCKYFPIKNSIVIVESLYFNCNFKKWEITLDDEKIYIEMENIKCKFWVMDLLDNYVMDAPSDRISSLIPYLYQVDITTLKLCQQNLTLNEFLFLSTKVEYIVLCEITVMNKDGSIVSLEKLVECLPKIKIFQLIDNFSSMVTKDTVAQLLQIQHFSNIYKFKLMNISEEFDIEKFFKYIKIIKKLAFFFTIHFPSEAYKNRLEPIIDEILSTESRDHSPPIITFNELADEKRKKMDLLYIKDYCQ